MKRQELAGVLEVAVSTLLTKTEMLSSSTRSENRGGSMETGVFE